MELGVKMQNFIIKDNELKQIANNLFLTDHARERMEARLGTTDLEIIKKSITHPFLAWRNVDGAINIALDNDTCLIIETASNGYVLVTVKEKSLSGTTTADKFAMAFLGKKMKRKQDNEMKNKNKNKRGKNKNAKNKTKRI